MSRRHVWSLRRKYRRAVFLIVAVLVLQRVIVAKRTRPHGRAFRGVRLSDVVDFGAALEGLVCLVFLETGHFVIFVYFAISPSDWFCVPQMAGMSI